MEQKLSLLFDFQSYENNEELQSVIDAVHRKYAAQQLSDDEAEFIAAAGRPEAAFKDKKLKEEWP